MMPHTLTCNSCGAANQAQARFCRVCGNPLQASQPSLYNSATGQLLANILLKQRYRIIKPLGQGGFGTVYQAEDIQLGNRLVALKEMSQSSLNPQKQKEAADAFKQEAIILANLRHHNLPSIFDHFKENNRWYLVMSLIEGKTLESYLSGKPGGKLPLKEVVDIGTQLCTVLGYLHGRQPPIIFRDLNPANIMRTSDGHIYLIDFGIARHFKPGQSKDTSNYGSNGYAPPEQYGKAQTTPRSDIYSLGATLHQLLSGHDPASSPFHFPPLQSLAAVPANLATLVTQMLEMDDAKRPANVLHVQQRLQTSTSPGVQNPNQSPLPFSPGPIAPTSPFSPLPQSGGSPLGRIPTLPVDPPPSNTTRPVVYLVSMVVIVLIILAGVLGIPFLEGQIGKPSSPSTQVTNITTATPFSSIGPFTNIITATPFSTPEQTLKDACSHFGTGDMWKQDMTANYRQRVDLPTFEKQWEGAGLTQSCDQVLNPTNGNSVTGIVVIKLFFRSLETYDVTLVKEGDGGWRIDQLTLRSS